MENQQNQQLWQTVLGELELSLSKASFTTWLKNTFIIENQDGKIIVAVPNTFSKEWLRQKYHQKIYSIIQSKIKERVKEISYKVETVKEYQDKMKNLKNIAEKASFAAPAHAPTFSQISASHGINPKYVFQNFIVGKSNELAHAAAQAVAEKPGETYNPLFIYGGAGLGKTHLIQAIGNAILEHRPDKKILYSTCEHFTNDFISAVSSGRVDRFIQTYRTCDILLIDDIQFLTGKEGTQEAFFHTFNELHQKDKQIILTSDRPPKAIATLEERLLTRFEWGMIADIGQPDLETRIAILEAKCREKEFILEREIIHFITLNIQNNIRELEGALNKIIAYHQLNKLQPTIENIKKILFSISESSKRSGAVSARQLIETACAYFDLGLDDIFGQSREKRLAFPRQIIMYLMREELRCSFPMIGNELGGRDHTTAMHAHDKITKMIDVDEKLRQDINLIKQRIYA